MRARAVLHLEMIWTFLTGYFVVYISREVVCNAQVPFAYNVGLEIKIR